MENPFEALEKKIFSRLDQIEAMIKEDRLRAGRSFRIGGIDLAREITGLQLPTIYKLVAKRRIPFSKPTGTRNLRFSEEKLLKWIEDGNMKTEEEIKSEVVLNLHKP